MKVSNLSVSDKKIAVVFIRTFYPPGVIFVFWLLEMHCLSPSDWLYNGRLCTPDSFHVGSIDRKLWTLSHSSSVIPDKQGMMYTSVCNMKKDLYKNS